MEARPLLLPRTRTRASGPGTAVSRVLEAGLTIVAAAALFSLGCDKEEPMPPTFLQLHGPRVCLVDSNYAFHANAHDANGDALDYMFWWGDGTSTEWCLGVASHAWDTSGVFVITCRARDAGGLVSEPTSLRLTALRGTVLYVAGDDTTYEAARCAQETRDGGFVLTGYAERNDTTCLCLVKVDAVGLVEWTRTFAGQDYTKGDWVVQTEDGGFVAVGYTGTPQGSTSMFMVRTTAGGDLLWTRTYGDYGYGGCVVLQGDGDYVVAGASNTGRAVCVEVSSDGTLLDTTDFAAGSLFSLAWTADNDLIGAGRGEDEHNLLVVRANPHGGVVWTKLLAVPGDVTGAVGTSVCVCPSGGYAIAVTTSHRYIGIERLDTGGDTLWTKWLDLGTGSTLHPYRILAEPDGGFTIAGGEPGLIVRTDASGEPTGTTTIEGANLYSLTGCSDGSGLLAGDVASDYPYDDNMLVIRVTR
jgi:hypothetical protein